MRLPGLGRWPQCHNLSSPGISSWRRHIEVSSGGREAHRLSRRGNRNINHAIHMAAICQIRHTHSEGRAYFDRKVAEGKTKREAIRSLKRQISNTVYRHLVLDAAK